MMILVTGSAGRVGSAVVDRLLGDGHAVCGLDRRATGRRSAGYREICCTFSNTETVATAMAGVDCVLHLGAFMSWIPADKTAMFEANVEGTRIVLDEAAKAGVRRFVFASSGEVYPENAPAFQPITEDHPLRPNSPYGLTKLLGEELVRYHQRTGKMETVILRFSHTQNAAELLDEENVFSGPRFFLQQRIRQQEAFGNRAVADILRAVDPGSPAHILARNENGRPFRMHITDTRDMVEGIILAMAHSDAVGETFNLGATNPVDFEPLLAQMSEITGLSITTVDLPGQGVYYHTSNDRIRHRLGFDPVWTIERMLAEAGRARQMRSGT